LFINTEHQVHILNGLTYGTFQEIVDAGGNQKFVIEGVDVDEAFVGVHHLFQIERLIDIVGESCILVEFLVGCNHFIGIGLGTDDLCGKDASGKVTAIRNKVDIDIQ